MNLPYYMSAYYKAITMKAMWNCHSNKSITELDRVMFIISVSVCIHMYTDSSMSGVKGNTMLWRFFLLKEASFRWATLVM